MTKLLTPCLLALCLCSCNLLPKTAALHDFGGTGELMANALGASPANEASIVEAPKWLYDNRIRYRLRYADPTQVRFYSLDRWLAPPPELFEQLLRTGNVDADAPVTVRLLKFEQEFLSKDQAKVVMQIRVSVPKTAHHGELFKEFQLEQPCVSADAKGGVAAFALVANKAAQAIADWLGQTAR